MMKTEQKKDEEEEEEEEEGVEARDGGEELTVRYSVIDAFGD